MNIRNQADINTKINLPKKWWSSPTYTLLNDTMINDTIVPKGFTTDGTTLSRWVCLCGLCVIGLAHVTTLWLLPIGLLLVLAPLMYPRVGSDFLAVVVHDYMLKTGSRYQADETYFDVMSWLKTNQFRKWLAYFGVKSLSLFKKDYL